MNQDLVEGFQILDMDGGAGWRLAKQLLSEESGERPTALQAGLSKFVAGENGLGGLDAVRLRDDTANSDWLRRQAKWVGYRMARSGTARVGGFTEAQLSEVVDIRSQEGRVPTQQEARLYLGRLVAETVRGIQGNIAAPPKAGKKAPKLPPLNLKNLFGGDDDQ